MIHKCLSVILVALLVFAPSILQATNTAQRQDLAVRSCKTRKQPCVFRTTDKKSVRGYADVLRTEDFQVTQGDGTDLGTYRYADILSVKPIRVTAPDELRKDLETQRKRGKSVTAKLLDGATITGVVISVSADSFEIADKNGAAHKYNLREVQDLPEIHAAKKARKVLLAIAVNAAVVFALWSVAFVPRD